MATFYPGEMFPDNVEFVNVSPAGKQQAIDCKFVCEGEANGWTDEQA